MEKVMILGAGPLQVPAIKKAKELGLFVIACDYDPNAVGFKYADVKLLISTIDKEAVLESAKKYHPNYIMTSTSDAPVKTVAYVSEKLGMIQDISYENAVCATEKNSMRKRLKKCEVPIPAFYACENFEEFCEALDQMDGICVVKPSDSAASRGVEIFDSDSSKVERKKQYDYSKSFSRNGIVMVEEYMKGPEVSVEGIIVNKELHIIAITDKLVTPLPFFVELGHSEPSQLPTSVQKDICDVTRKAVAAIGIVNGTCHAELKITDKGPKIVEIAARLGGDYITSCLVPLSTGVDLVGNSILLALHRPISIEKTRKQGSAIRFISGEEGVVKKIEIKEEAKNIEGIYEIQIYVQKGQKVRSLQSSNDRLGHVIAIGETAEQAIERAEKALDNIIIEISEE
ncbi:MAG: ATP-grasp domain-containing protein [[Eubacterium] rectale]|nr:ATP-grasp domain-containing protein [Agathobacter rectalis]